MGNKFVTLENANTTCIIGCQFCGKTTEMLKLIYKSGLKTLFVSPELSDYEILLLSNQLIDFGIDKCFNNISSGEFYRNLYIYEKQNLETVIKRLDKDKQIKIVAVDEIEQAFENKNDIIKLIEYCSNNDLKLIYNVTSMHILKDQTSSPLIENKEV